MFDVEVNTIEIPQTAVLCMADRYAMQKQDEYERARLRADSIRVSIAERFEAEAYRGPN